MNTKQQVSKPGGFTLVEIMIVVVIMGMIASAVGIAVFNQFK